MIRCLYQLKYEELKLLEKNKQTQTKFFCDLNIMFFDSINQLKAADSQVNKNFLKKKGKQIKKSKKNLSPKLDEKEEIISSKILHENLENKEEIKKVMDLEDKEEINKGKIQKEKDIEDNITQKVISTNSSKRKQSQIG